ncbi:uncharacterized protein UMAG_11065 [Mycosarcoma maydis]|uniref:Uncharacterized protein n=1 Tax=Mycosarcoma maydis TaxID=5270 RepID=A0A0D1DXF0_MYCMD|nr:uncharacterized protein UMAG_11065 [Ustilago maydis 521]KIS68291.1 hypothetical protein UMAG_11065 [Ustilago maydis 521]|eukprot:XP_011390073.1 hypothetical protein UMAG_11065 [Ustilago maydis 521]
MALDDFIYNAEHGVVVCRRCATCLVPREQSWMKHLRAKPHELKGSYLQLTVEHLATYSLRSSDQLRAQAKDTSRQPHPCQPIAGLALYDGFICHCAPGECTYKTRRIKLMRDHLAVHGKKGKQHSDTTPLWRACQLQTYFTAKGMIDYFEVDASALPTAPLDPPSLTCTCTSASTSTPTTTRTSSPTMTCTSASTLTLSSWTPGRLQ